MKFLKVTRRQSVLLLGAFIAIALIQLLGVYYLTPDAKLLVQIDIASQFSKQSGNEQEMLVSRGTNPHNSLLKCEVRQQPNASSTPQHELLHTNKTSTGTEQALPKSSDSYYQSRSFTHNQQLKLWTSKPEQSHRRMPRVTIRGQELPLINDNHEPPLPNKDKIPISSSQSREQRAGIVPQQTYHKLGSMQQTYHKLHSEPVATPRDVVCPTVHIAMVLCSNIESWHSYLAIKSILMHRTTKLHFHFISDNMTRTVLSSMLSSWLLPGLSHDYYDLSEAWRRIGRSYNNQCYGTLVLKLDLPQILPENITRVVVLEPTLIVKIDVYELWSVTMSCEDHMITLCSERCVLHCHRDTAVLHNKTDNILLWGAMALNLDGIRALGQGNANTWTLAVKQVNICRPNAVEMFYNAVQKWSITLNDANTNWNPYTRTGFAQPSLTERCWEIISVFTSQHFNQIHLLNNTAFCTHVREYDGNMLRYKEVESKNNNCSTEMQPLVQEAPHASTLCKLFSWERETQRRELPFLLKHSYNSTDAYDVTTVNHLDYNRLYLMESSCQNWEGPISIAIQVTDSQVQEVIDFISSSVILRKRRNISYHLMFRIGPSYPINPLRELAYRHIETPYVFYNDIDFVSSYGIYTTIKNDLRMLGNSSKVAIVVAAFETQDSDFKFPRDKSELLELIVRKTVYHFHRKTFPEGHAQTNYVKWVSATQPYYVNWKYLYEPYYVLHTSVFTFDTRFVARFQDKGSHSIELHLAGFQFLVLHDCFIIHLPHPVNLQNKAALNKCSREWYTEWITQKFTQYIFTTGQP